MRENLVSTESPCNLNLESLTWDNNEQINQFFNYFFSCYSASKRVEVKTIAQKYELSPYGLICAVMAIPSHDDEIDEVDDEFINDIVRVLIDSDIKSFLLFQTNLINRYRKIKFN